MTPADELTTAADKLRAATPAEPAFIRLSEPLAAWLDRVALSAAHIHSLFADSDDPDEFIGPHALAVARAINGPTP